MSRDREAVVWTRLATRPQRMGRLYITDSDCRFTYDADYLATGLPGVGLIYAPEIYKDNTIVRSRSENFDFLPPIQALVPPRSQHNFQRQLILNYLAKQGKHPARGIDTDWEILKVSGHGGIGHLDVFESDEKALEWYSAPARSGLFAIGDDFGFSLKEFLAWFDHDAEFLIQAIGPTPSVGGAIPKLLVTIPDTGWDGRIGLPSKQTTPGVTDVVLKLEQSNIYPGMLELEALTLDIHKAAGFDVPRYWPADVNGIPALAVERFDRDKNRNPVFMESLYSILASGDKSITHNYSYTYDMIGRAIDRSPISLVADQSEAKLYLFKRLMLALLTGNGDMHMENLSIIRPRDELQFSPVYDPTPMRAYSIHNMLSAMTFGGYGDWPDNRNNPVGLEEAVQAFARNLNISRTVMKHSMEHVLSCTDNYPDKVMALETLPLKNKQQLVAVVSLVRDALKKLLI
ncbi:MAG TPA: HipA domain-containing protein [Gammaproteobacteria bacterium]